MPVYHPPLDADVKYHDFFNYLERKCVWRSAASIATLAERSESVGFLRLQFWARDACFQTEQEMRQTLESFFSLPYDHLVRLILDGTDCTESDPPIISAIVHAIPKLRDHLDSLEVISFSDHEYRRVP